MRPSKHALSVLKYSPESLYNVYALFSVSVHNFSTELKAGPDCHDCR